MASDYHISKYAHTYLHICTYINVHLHVHVHIFITTETSVVCVCLTAVNDVGKRVQLQEKSR